MTLSAPKKWTFWLGVILWVIGLIGLFLEGSWSPILEQGLEVWLGFLGGLIIAIGNLFEGL